MGPGDYAGSTGTTFVDMEISSQPAPTTSSSNNIPFFQPQPPGQSSSSAAPAADRWSVASESEAGPKRNQKFWRYGSGTNSRDSSSREETSVLLPQQQQQQQQAESGGGSNTNIPALVATSGDGTVTTFLSIPYTRIGSSGNSDDLSIPTGSCGDEPLRK